MAKQCEICGKSKMGGHTKKLLRGHYNITGKRTFKPNLQKKKMDGRSVIACVKCIKARNKATAAQAKA